MPDARTENDADVLYDWRSRDLVARRICAFLLALAEHLYLIAYGWRRTDEPRDSEAAWLPPHAHPKAGEFYGRSHAVNSMRYYLGGAQPRQRRNNRASGPQACRGSMSASLDQRLEMARRVPVSAAEREKQRRSFAFGNTNIDNQKITRETIDRAVEKLSRG